MKEKEEEEKKLKEKEEEEKKLKEKEEEEKKKEKEKELQTNLKNNLKESNNNLKKSHIKNNNNNKDDMVNPLSISRQSSAFRRSRKDSINSLSRSITPESKPISSYDLSFFTGNLKDFITIYNHYIKSVPENQKYTLNLQEDIKSSILLTNAPKIILCSDTKSKYNIKGICIFTYTIDNSKIKIIINHISCYNDIEKEIVFNKLIDFIQKNIENDEIYIDLYYKFDSENNKFNFCTDLRDLFKNILHFKWVKLENLANHIRFQKMVLRKEDDENINNLNLIINNKYIPQSILNIKNSTCVILTENEIEKKENHNKFSNYFSCMFLLNKLQISEGFNINNLNENEIFNQEININELSINKILNINLNENNFNSSLNDDLNENNNKKLFNILEINFHPIFHSIIFTKINNYNYCRIESKEIKILIDKNTGNEFYLIPNYDENNLIIISQLNEANKKNLIDDNEKNIYKVFRDYYHKLEQEENKNNNNNNLVLYIPSFEINNHSCNNFENEKEKIFLSKENKNWFVEKIDEKIEIKFGQEENDINFIYEKEENNNNNNKEIIINDNFLFSVVNIDVLSHLNFPSILLLYITKDDWIKSQ